MASTTKATYGRRNGFNYSKDSNDLAIASRGKYSSQAPLGSRSDKSGGSSNYGNSRPATTWGNFLERAQSREGTRVPATRNDNTFANSRSEFGNNGKSPSLK